MEAAQRLPLPDTSWMNAPNPPKHVHGVAETRSVIRLTASVTFGTRLISGRWPGHVPSGRHEDLFLNPLAFLPPASSRQEPEYQEAGVLDFFVVDVDLHLAVLLSR